MRLLPYAVATFLVAAVTSIAGCAYPTPPRPQNLDGSTLARFDRVADGVYRGSQPKPAELHALVDKYGIKTVVQLNTGAGDPVPAGTKLVSEPLNPEVTPSEERMTRILDELDAAEKPVFVHCTHGEDRTGLVVALYQIRHGLSVDAAYVDMVRHGFHPYRGLWAAWIRAVGWDKPLPPSTAPDQTAAR